MKTKRIAYLMIFFVGVLTATSLILGVCAQSSPAPAPPTAPEVTEIKILGLPLGYTAYPLTFGLTDSINKHSKKLHATFEVGTGTYANQLYIIKNPEAAKDTIIFTNQVTIWMGHKAWPPLKQPYFDFRCITKTVTNLNTWLTFDPNIKTLKDMVGKRVGVGPRPSSIWAMPQIIFDYLGITDKISLTWMSFGAIKDALLAGTIDAGFLAFTHMENNTVIGIPATDELMRTKKTYIMSIPEDVLRGAEKASGCWLGPAEWSLRATGPTPAQKFWAMNATNSWWAHKDMNDGIVTELLEVLYKNIAEMAFYDVSGKAMTRKAMAKVAIPEELFHRAAIKFYKEKGLEIGWK